MSNNKNNKSVVVIGGTGGIGFAIAKFYADSGAKVVITGRDQGRTAGVAAEIGKNVRGIGLDVAEPERVEKALAELEHVDYLALVAVERDYNSAREYDIARARRIVTMKLIGYTEVAHSLYPRMGAGGSSVLFAGRKPSRRLMCRMQSASSRTAKWATPLFVLWVIAPPRSSKLTSSEVTARMTSGPVTNM